jgi:hypothetical protein
MGISWDSSASPYTVQSIQPVISLLRSTYPNAGAEDMRKHLLSECGLKVPRYAYFHSADGSASQLQ